MLWNHCKFNSVGHGVYHVGHDHILHWRGREIYKSHISFGSVRINPIPAAQVDFNNNYYHKVNGQLELINILSLPISFYSPPSGSAIPFPLELCLSRVLVGLRSWWLVARLTHPVPYRKDGCATQPPLTAVLFSLVTGIGPRGGQLIKSIRILLQYLGIRVRRVVSSIFLNTSW